MDEHKTNETTHHELETRICHLEDWQHRQNGSIQRIEQKVDRMIYLHFAELAAIIGGLVALINHLINHLWTN